MSLMPRPVGNRHCPHCGKVLRRGGGVTLHPFIPVLLLGAAFFLWTRGSSLPAHALNPQAAPSASLPAGIADYITSPSDKSCVACMASAILTTRRDLLKDMARVPVGDYQIGSPEGLGDPDEHPLHQVHLDAFYIDKNETTISDYLKFSNAAGDNYPEWADPKGSMNVATGQDPYYRHLSSVFTSCGTCPVVGVTFRGAQAYCRSRNKRLPTEAEWETAARGGESPAFSFGDLEDLAGDYSWNETNSDGRPQPVGSKKANKYGLFDMHGNAFEWISDFYEPDYYKTSPKNNPKGPPTGKEHVVRGGSFAFDADSMRSGNRASTIKANDDIGFRCAVSESDLAVDAPSGPVVISRN